MVHDRRPRAPGRRGAWWWRLHLPDWLRPGRRGLILLTFAGIYGAYGSQVHPSSPERVERLHYLFALMPSQGWQLAWWAAALIAASRAWSRRDAVAYVALEVLATVWAGAQWAAYVLDGNTGAAGFGALFTLIVLLLRIIDGWVELPTGFLDARDPRGPTDPRDIRQPEDPRDRRELTDPADPRDPREPR